MNNDRTVGGNVKWRDEVAARAVSECVYTEGSGAEWKSDTHTRCEWNDTSPRVECSDVGG